MGGFFDRKIVYFSAICYNDHVMIDLYDKKV